MKNDEFAFFNQQLAAMLRDGIPLEGALRRLCQEMRRGNLRDELQALEADLAKGTPMAGALAMSRSDGWTRCSRYSNVEVISNLRMSGYKTYASRKNSGISISAGSAHHRLVRNASAGIAMKLMLLAADANIEMPAIHHGIFRSPSANASLVFCLRVNQIPTKATIPK